MTLFIWSERADWWYWRRKCLEDMHLNMPWCRSIMLPLFFFFLFLPFLFFTFGVSFLLFLLWHISSSHCHFLSKITCHSCLQRHSFYSLAYWHAHNQLCIFDPQFMASSHASVFHYHTISKGEENWCSLQTGRLLPLPGKQPTVCISFSRTPVLFALSWLESWAYMFFPTLSLHLICCSPHLLYFY